MVKTAPTYFMIMLLVIPIAAASEPAVQVDRRTVAMKESFTLTIEVPGSGATNQPDLSVIEEHFSVVRGAKNTEIKVVDGETRARTQFFYTLTPKRPGKLAIPAFTIGEKTTLPISINVTEAAIVAADAHAPDLFLEAALTDTHPLVQSQVTYTMRLFHAIDIREGILSEPELRDAVVLRLGDDVQYEVDRYERRYQVVERHYAVFPEVSGQMMIPSPIFSGQLPQQRELSALDDSFGQRGGSSGNPFGSFFHSTRPVKISGPELQIHVQPVPPGYNRQTWLPAAALEIEETWTTRPLTFKVGEPTTRTLTVRGRAVTAAHLPEISVKSTETMKVYADRPLTRTSSKGKFVVGERKVKFALVPTEPGPLTLPPVVVEWWDTTTETLRRTKISARDITVLSSDAFDSSAQGIVPRDTTGKGQKELYRYSQHSLVWPFIVMALSVIWLITFIAWRRARKQGRTQSKLDSEQVGISIISTPDLHRACIGNNAPDAKEALIHWASQRWKDQSPRTLMAVACCVNSPKTTIALMELDRVLYDSDDSIWTSGEQLWSCLQSETRAPKLFAKQRGAQLPNLYPD